MRHHMAARVSGSAVPAGLAASAADRCTSARAGQLEGTAVSQGPTDTWRKGTGPHVEGAGSPDAPRSALRTADVPSGSGTVGHHGPAGGACDANDVTDSICAECETYELPADWFHSARYSARSVSYGRPTHHRCVRAWRPTPAAGTCCAVTVRACEHSTPSGACGGAGVRWGMPCRVTCFTPLHAPVTSWQCMSCVSRSIDEEPPDADKWFCFDCQNHVVRGHTVIGCPAHACLPAPI